MDTINENEEPSSGPQQELVRQPTVHIRYEVVGAPNANGWCSRCGCGNDLLGYRHLENCPSITGL